MVHLRIGAAIKTLRIKNNLSQKELSNGICTQGHISKIEKGNEIPSSYLLHLLSHRLGVDENYFFKVVVTENFQYVEETNEKIREAIKNRDYEKVNMLVSSELQLNNYTTPLERQFLIWHQGICEYYVNDNARASIQLLKKSLKITLSNFKLLSEDEIQIINSIAIIFSENGEFKKAIKLFRYALNYLQKLPYVRDKNLYIRLCYGLSKSLGMNQDIAGTLEITRLGIAHCLKEESLYMLGELLYNEAYCLEEIGDIEKSKDIYKKVYHLFSIQNNELFANVTKMKFN